ncbi:MAG: signal peptidase II [Clostridia bacterium]|nr:signal peptidase II [Clostridia bacterium]
MIYAIIFFAALILDQVSKAIVDSASYERITIIKNVLSIEQVSMNPGAALSMLADKGWAQAFFICLTVLTMAILVLYFIFKKDNSKWLNISLALIASGALGNFIDRLAFKAVRDFIGMNFYFVSFSCNVADIAISVGGVMIVFYFLFLDKDAIFKKKEKPNDK